MRSAVILIVPAHLTPTRSFTAGLRVLVQIFCHHDAQKSRFKRARVVLLAGVQGGVGLVLAPNGANVVAIGGWAFIVMGATHAALVWTRVIRTMWRWAIGILAAFLVETIYHAGQGQPDAQQPTCHPSMHSTRTRSKHTRKPKNQSYRIK